MYVCIVRIPNVTRQWPEEKSRETKQKQWTRIETQIRNKILDKQKLSELSPEENETKMDNIDSTAQWN